MHEIAKLIKSVEAETQALCSIGYESKRRQINPKRLRVVAPAYPLDRWSIWYRYPPIGAGGPAKAKFDFSLISNIQAHFNVQIDMGTAGIKSFRGPGSIIIPWPGGLLQPRIRLRSLGATGLTIDAVLTGVLPRR